MRSLDARILDALPQTQCTRCGYPDCAAYAAAIATQQASINRCPPGGAEGVARLAAITGQPPLALDPDCGHEEPRQIAFIDESWCIGCTLCLSTCPTDAIFGIAKQMHSVIEMHCTGCALCLPACPVDCIVLEPASGERTGWQAWSAEQADAARQRYAQRQQRMQAAVASPAAETQDPTAEPAPVDRTASHRAIVEAAMARARARSSGR